MGRLPPVLRILSQGLDGPAQLQDGGDIREIDSQQFLDAGKVGALANQQTKDAGAVHFR